MIFKSKYCFANISATEAQIFMKFETYLDTVVKTHQIIFRKDPNCNCGDICKTILTFKNPQFSMYFAYFHIFAPPKSSQMDNY